MEGEDGMARRLWVGVLGTLLVGVSAVVVSAAPAGANAVCGQAVSTSLTLTHDLNCPNSGGLFVTASNVVLDLGGHTISGTTAPQPGFSGVNVGSGSGVVVRNGTIRGFNRGVASNPGSTGALITGLVLDANATGIAMGNNNATGVGTRSMRIVNNVISNTTQGAGVSVAGNGNLVQANTITNTNSTGIFVLGDDNFIASNTIVDSGASGIAVDRSPSDPGPFERNRITGNRVSGSGRLFNATGISIRFGLGTIVEGNTVVGRRATPGIFVDQSVNTLVRANTVTDNSTGILIRNSSGTNVIQNRATLSNFTGIFVESTATNTVVDRNVASDNNSDGINVASPSTVISSNTAYNNGNLGIRAVAGVTDGGGNRAFNNGNPAQCSPTITCTS